MRIRNLLGLGIALLLLISLGAPEARAEEGPLSLIRPAKVYGVDIIGETNANCRVFFRIGLENHSPVPLMLTGGALSLSIDFGDGEEILIGQVLIKELKLPTATGDELIPVRVEFEPEGEKTPRQVLELIKMIVKRESTHKITCRGRGSCGVSLAGKKTFNIPYEFVAPVRPLHSIAQPGDVILQIKGKRDD